MKTRREVPVAVHPFRKNSLETDLKIGGNSRNYLDFSCLSCCFGTMNARDYEHSTNIVERLCLPLMAYEPADRLLVLNGIQSVEKLEDLVSRMLIVSTWEELLKGH